MHNVWYMSSWFDKRDIVLKDWWWFDVETVIFFIHVYY